MSVNLVPEDDLRAALRPFRVDPGIFEAAVRQRLKSAQEQPADRPLSRLSPWLRSAAAFLPLEVLAGCKAPPVAAKLAPCGGAYKLLSYLAFPAISLFVLLGATVFSIAKIRSLPKQNGSELGDQDATQAAIREWWRRHKWSAMGVFAATLTLMAVGATWTLFLFYLISFGLLLLVLNSFAKLGLGNRLVVGQFCGMGLMFLFQATMMVGIGDQEIHFVDQKVVSAILLCGVLGLVPLVYRARMAGRPMGMGPQRVAVGLVAILGVPLLVWILNPYLWPVTPSRMKSYVESFHEAPYGGLNWRQWEIAASWAIESKLDPDLAQPRRLLAEEISGKQDRFILSSALRVGLVPADQVGQLKEYEEMRRSLVDDPPRGLKPQAISSLAQYDWVIRVAVLRNDLSPQERNLLEKRLHATLEDLSESHSDVLDMALRVTQLLNLIQRPLDRDQYRSRVHDWLRKFHSTTGGGFQLAGGFKEFLALRTGSLEATSHGVELMEIYGIPDDLDLNWVRAFLRPLSYRPMDQKWIAAATLDRLNRLPGATRPSWLEFLYYERSLIAAAVLVGLCIYATVSSPRLQTIGPVDESLQSDPQDTAAGQSSE